MTDESNTATDSERDPLVDKVEQLEPETAEAIYDLTKEAPEKQITSAASLDTKMVQVFAAASIVMGFLGLSSAVDLVGGRRLMLALLVGALIAYACTAGAASLHLKPREFYRNLEASRWLTPAYLSLKEDQFRRVAIVDTARAYANNNAVLETKAKCMQFALASTAIEVVLVAAALILYRLA